MAADLSALFQGAKPQGMMAGMEEGMNQANIISEIANRGTSAAMNEAMAGQYRASTNSMQQKLPYELSKMGMENTQLASQTTPEYLKAKTGSEMAGFGKSTAEAEAAIKAMPAQQLIQMQQQSQKALEGFMTEAYQQLVGSNQSPSDIAVNLLNKYGNQEMLKNDPQMAQQMEQMLGWVGGQSKEQIMPQLEKILYALRTPQAMDPETVRQIMLEKIRGQNQQNTAAAGRAGHTPNYNYDDYIHQSLVQQGLKPGTAAYTQEFARLKSMASGSAVPSDQTTYMRNKAGETVPLVTKSKDTGVTQPRAIIKLD